MRFSNIVGGLFGKKSESQEAQRPPSDSPSIPLTPADVARQERQRQAAASHQGVLNVEFAKELERADEGVKFPETPDVDSLAYLGNLGPLGLSDEERKIVREWTRELIAEKGERAVWNSRIRLKLELRYLTTDASLRKGIGRFPSERRQ
ncbi:MAG: hypothetical protein JXA58_07110 [Dehalococcoidia bacterium]|nr:hypothetical protein [Dehalococcoidia bacterium]